MAQNEGSSGSVLLAFILGAAAGAAVALLYAPATGAETRRKIARKVQEGRERVEAMAEEGREFVERQRENLASAVDRGREIYEEGREAYDKARKEFA